MTSFEKTYDADLTIPGYYIKLGDVLMGDCFSSMPAVIIESSETRYPVTEKEYDEYGTTVPKLIDVEFGCELYHNLRNLPMPVEMQDCSECPLNNPQDEVSA